MAETLETAPTAVVRKNDEGNQYRLISAGEREWAKNFAKEQGEGGIPDEYKIVVTLEDGAIVPGDEESKELFEPYQGIGATARKIVKCGAHLTIAVLPVGRAASGIRALGEFARPLNFLSEPEIIRTTCKLP